MTENFSLRTNYSYESRIHSGADHQFSHTASSFGPRMSRHYTKIRNYQCSKIDEGIGVSVNPTLFFHDLTNISLPSVATSATKITRSLVRTCPAQFVSTFTNLPPRHLVRTLWGLVLSAFPHPYKDANGPNHPGNLYLSASGGAVGDLSIRAQVKKLTTLRPYTMRCAWHACPQPHSASVMRVPSLNFSISACTVIRRHRVSSAATRRRSRPPLQILIRI